MTTGTDTGIRSKIIDTERRNNGPFQRTLHSGDVELRYHSRDTNRNVSWSSEISSKLRRIKSDGDNVYDFDRQHHMAVNTYIVVKTRHTEVDDKCKDMIRICYTNNLLHHIHGKGILSMDERAAQTITPLVLDSIRAKRPYNSIYEEGIGNIHSFLNWRTELPSKSLSMFLPLLYTEHNTRALPLYEKSINNKVKLIYKFNLDPSKFIRMQALLPVKGDSRSSRRESENKNVDKTKNKKSKIVKEWRDIPFNPNFIKGKLAKLKPPKIYTYYINLAPGEINIRTKGTNGNNPSYVLNYTDFIEVKDGSDMKSLGETSVITLTSSSPARYVSWMYRNNKAYELNYLSNYTNDPDNIYTGDNPAVNARITYENSDRVSKRDIIHFQRCNPMHYFKTVCREKGYYWHSFDSSPNSLKVGNTVVLSSQGLAPVKITCLLGIPGTTDDEDDDNDQTVNDRIKESTIEQEILSLGEGNVKKEEKDKYQPLGVIYVFKKLIIDHDTEDGKDKFFIIDSEDAYVNYNDHQKE